MLGQGSNIRCMAAGVDSVDCANVQSWDPNSPTACTANGQPGVCSAWREGNTVRRQCFTPLVTFDSVRTTLQNAAALFDNDPINGFVNFDRTVYTPFPQLEARLIAMYTQAAIVWTSIQQQLVLLGGGNNPATALTTRLPQFATFLRDQVASVTNTSVYEDFVNSMSSTFWEPNMRARWSCASPSRSGIFAALDLSDLYVRWTKPVLLIVPL